MKTTLTFDKLPLKFYKRDVLIVARELLGKTLIRKKNNLTFAGIIVETEAYDGKTDQAAHSFNGMTKRNETMFKGGGYLYVYFSYGNHYCCNVVTGNPGDGSAVLIRAVEPTNEIDAMAINRYSRSTISDKELLNLTNGPGKLCKAFSIDLTDDAANLRDDKIFILNTKKDKSGTISTSERIGISKSVDLPWRFFISNNKFVSRK
ncbi:MAG TPA: DNA-3-methyladenine glycosylase [Ignavibacteriaceae bacterium]|nr:DNA-3-methyladenine glycosylase [Ignavibacteriaceae bacterium]